MILEAYVALAQEPWCFHPEQIAKLTDWQIAKLYLEPAWERAEKLREDVPPPPAGGRPNLPPRRGGRAAAPDYEPGTPEHREQLVTAAFMGVMGMKREQAERYYDRQLAAWQAERARKG